jgi:V/A-type H+-transporting ATPase subunit K
MDWAFAGQMGMVLCLGMAAVGSSLGVWAAGQSAAGAWAKEARAGARLRFNYIIFIGAPMSQTFYAMIVMNKIARLFAASPDSFAAHAGLLLGIGITTGLGELFSAWGQGAIGAAACRCLSEGEGKGLAFLLIAIGIVETVGIFTMVFMLGKVPTV